MRYSLFSLAFVPVFFMLTACNQAGQTEKQPSVKDTETTGKFDIQRGTNISHWLSQSDRRGDDRQTFFTRDDMEYIASLGYDHIRLPIDEEQMWNKEGTREEAAFDLLHSAIQWALDNDLKVVVDLHIIRSHHFNEEEKPLWTDPEAQETFIDLWRDLSATLHEYPTDMVAYELMNEAVADHAGEWNQLLARAHAAVRELEPNRKIVIGSNRWQSVDTFHELKVPEGDKNIILSFHYYSPFLLTHHQASWTYIKDYEGPVHYPGKTVKEEDLEGYSDEVKEAVATANGVFTKESMAEHIDKAVVV
ncbi:MAG: glycoside hydrolase family 5 protein, partial [Bacteroidota bacterium]